MSSTGCDPPGVGRQAIEGNALTDDEIAMFEMFEREGWSSEQRRAYILAVSRVVPDDELFISQAPNERAAALKVVRGKPVEMVVCTDGGFQAPKFLM